MSDQVEDPQLPSKPKSRKPRTTRRYNPDGDYKVMMFLVPSESVPKGAMVQLEGSPDFADAQKAKTWVKSNLADLAGMRLAIVRVSSLLSVKTPEVPSVVLEERAKPFTSDGEED